MRNAHVFLILSQLRTVVHVARELECRKRIPLAVWWWSAARLLITLVAVAGCGAGARVVDWMETTTGFDVPFVSGTRGDRALVIGINRYANPRNNLRGAVRDARNIKGLLSRDLGFESDQILLLTNEQATRDAILTGVRDWLVAGTRPGARAMFYFSGHGDSRPDYDGDERDGKDEALVPHDERRILDDEIGSLFADLHDRQVYLIVDSCYSGTITRSASKDPDPSVVRTIGRYDARPQTLDRSIGADKMRAPRRDSGFIEVTGNLVAWTAVEAHQLAIESPEGGEWQGVFTRRFVDGIAERRADRDRDGRVTHAELLEYVRNESRKYCRRNPCRAGHNPLLEGPPEVLARDVTR